MVFKPAIYAAPQRIAPVVELNLRLGLLWLTGRLAADEPDDDTEEGDADE